jgi:hypothetical protein
MADGIAGRWRGCSIGCTCDDRASPIAPSAGWIERGVVFSGVEVSAKGYGCVSATHAAGKFHLGDQVVPLRWHVLSEMRSQLPESFRGDEPAGLALGSSTPAVCLTSIAS